MLNKESILERCNQLAAKIYARKDDLYQIASSYESYHTMQDEIIKGIDCLERIEEESGYFQKKFKTMATMFPLNLPLYSLILFALIPSFMAEAVYIRPPFLMQDILKRIFQVLDIESLFPNIHIINANREEFTEKYIKHADVVLFTGKYSNARKIQDILPKSTLFIYNGAGVNPIIIHKNAVIEIAVEKTVEVKCFNSGQDCAGPDGILVQEEVYQHFLEELYRKLSEQKIGDYADKSVSIGRLIEPEHLTFIGKVLLKESDCISYGGIIDYRNKIVHPTVILSDLTDNPPFDELYAPVIRIFKYKTENDLDKYFQHTVYLQNAMYVSVFGNFEYIKKIRNTVVLRNKIILDVERGNLEYGGYSKMGTFVSKDGKMYHHPILISREISRYL